MNAEELRRFVELIRWLHKAEVKAQRKGANESHNFSEGLQ